MNEKNYYAREEYLKLTEILAEIKSKSLKNLLTKIQMLPENQKRLLENNILFQECPNCTTFNLEEKYVEEVKNIGYFNCENCSSKFKVDYEKSKGTMRDYEDIENIPKKNH